jgi:putative tricarboxylic transport membrane protein
MERTQDMVVGLLFALVGLGAAWIAWGYSGATGIYPMALGIAMGVLGTGLAVGAALSGRQAKRILLPRPRPVACTLAIAAIYTWAVGRLGFFTSSALLMLLLPPVLGFRRPIFLVVAGLVFVAAMFLIFAVALQKPLPREIWLSR